MNTRWLTEKRKCRGVQRHQAWVGLHGFARIAAPSWLIKPLFSSGEHTNTAIQLLETQLWYHCTVFYFTTQAHLITNLVAGQQQK